MKTCHGEQRKAHQGEKMHAAGMTADLGMLKGSHQTHAVAVGSVSRKARKVLGLVQTGLEVSAVAQIAQ